MRTIKILTLLLTLFTGFAQAQETATSTDQERSIEINNTNGNLFIRFTNDKITKFVVNKVPVAKERYEDYQVIIDDFSDEEVIVNADKNPEPPAKKENKGAKLKEQMLSYLMNQGHINSFTKYKVKLKKKALEVNGKKMSDLAHQDCLDFFKEIYRENLNRKSEVYFKRSGDKSKTRIQISF